MSPPGRGLWRIAVGYALLIAAWTVVSPPFSAPDEWSHYLRALDISRGELIGAEVPAFRNPTLSPRQEAWVAQSARSITVPAGMAPDGGGCNAFRPEASAACLADTAVPTVPVRRIVVNGTYQPAAYFAPAAAMRLAHRRDLALMLARAASAATCVALIALALAAAGTPIHPGMHVALTPMVLYLSSVLNPSGPEVSSAVALMTAALALRREGAERRTNIFVALAVGGAVLCLSRSLGPLFVLMIALLAVVVVGVRRFAHVARAVPGRVIATIAIVGVAAAMNRIWEMEYGPRLSFPRTEPAVAALRASIGQLPEWWREVVGVFQYMDSRLPSVAYALWGLAAAIVLLEAFRAGTARGRVALALSFVLAVAAPVLLHAFVLRPIEWAVQGRHVLPIVVTVPLVAAEIGRDRIRISRLAAILCPAIQVIALFEDAHRSAVGVHGAWSFPFRAEWTPPGGWFGPLAAGCIGAGLIAWGALAPRVRTGASGPSARGCRTEVATSCAGPYATGASPESTRCRPETA